MINTAGRYARLTHTHLPRVGPPTRARAPAKSLSLARGSSPADQVPAALGSLSFYVNANTSSGAQDFARQLSLPATFGVAEFTYIIELLPDDSLPSGAGGGSSLSNWATNNPTRYGNDSGFTKWWYPGNFVVDGFNNNNNANGTFAIQLFNDGRVRWTLGDGAPADALNGDVHGIQNPAGISVLDGNRHLVACRRRWVNTADAALGLWVDGEEQDEQISIDGRVNMRPWWDAWAGFSEAGLMYAAEKIGALGGSYWEDYKGRVGRVFIYDRALSNAELAALPTTIPTSGLVGLYRMGALDGSNRTYDSLNAEHYIEVTPRGANPGWVPELV